MPYDELDYAQQEVERQFVYNYYYGGEKDDAAYDAEAQQEAERQYVYNYYYGGEKDDIAEAQLEAERQIVYNYYYGDKSPNEICYDEGNGGHYDNCGADEDHNYYDEYGDYPSSYDCDDAPYSNSYQDGW